MDRSVYSWGQRVWLFAPWAWGEVLDLVFSAVREEGRSVSLHPGSWILGWQQGLGPRPLQGWEWGGSQLSPLQPRRWRWERPRSAAASTPEPSQTRLQLHAATLPPLLTGIRQVFKQIHLVSAIKNTSLPSTPGPSVQQRPTGPWHRQDPPPGPSAQPASPLDRLQGSTGSYSPTPLSSAHI